MSHGLSIPEDDDLEKIERLKDNFDWFYSKYCELKTNYNNQYVAIKNKKQIDNDRDLDTLVKRLKLHTYDDSIAIEFVDP